MDQVDCIDFDNDILTLVDGTELPITDYFDEYGDDCDPDEAVVLVAGKDGVGWLSVKIDWDSLEPVTLN